MLLAFSFPLAFFGFPPEASSFVSSVNLTCFVSVSAGVGSGTGSVVGAGAASAVGSTAGAATGAASASGAFAGGEGVETVASAVGGAVCCC